MEIGARESTAALSPAENGPPAISAGQLIRTVWNLESVDQASAKAVAVAKAEAVAGVRAPMSTPIIGEHRLAA